MKFIKRLGESLIKQLQPIEKRLNINEK